jgi:hypothetical protein
MKRMMLLTAMIVFSVNVGAQTNLFTTVTNLWQQGYRSNVLAIANTRLQQNTNDLVGLFIKVEYDIEFAQRHSISNSAARLFAVGDTITSTNFLNVYPAYREDLLYTLDYIRESPITGNQLLEEQNKGNLNHLPFWGSEELEALQKDGYFD